LRFPIDTEDPSRP